MTRQAVRQAEEASYQMFDLHVVKKLTAEEVAKRLDVNWRRCILPSIKYQIKLNLRPLHQVILGALLVLSPFQAAAQVQWQLAWSDEFNGATNSLPNPTNWAYDNPTAGASNGELEMYCGQPGAGQSGDCAAWGQNAHLDGQGNLLISAIRQPDGKWTSARLITHGKFVFTYGRAEARMKLPVGAGLWPAFWMLGDNLYSGTSWPNCGEQDSMENVPALGPSTIRSSLNGPRYNSTNALHADYTFPNGGRIDTGFHIYGLIWKTNLVQYYVDDYTRPFVSFSPANMPTNGVWAFNNHPFFILLNLAVGGGWPGNPDANTPSPAKMFVDYVRVYQPAVAPTISVPPRSQTVACHSNATLTVVASGSAPLFYQWRFNGSNILSANAPSLLLHNPDPSAAGRYSVLVTNIAGWTNSSEAVLTIVNTNPPTLLCPTNLSLACAGPDGTQAFFSPNATSSCGTNVNVVCTPPSGSFFPLGANTVGCVATDSSGNRSGCSFSVTVEDPMPLLLSITLQGTNIFVSWPQTCATYVLEENSSLDSPVTWSPSQLSVGLGAGKFTATNSLGNSNKFFRLRKN